MVKKCIKRDRRALKMKCLQKGLGKLASSSNRVVGGEGHIDVKNKQKRQFIVGTNYRQNIKVKKSEKNERKLIRQNGDIPDVTETRTIDMMREPDDTIVEPGDMEIALDEKNDEFGMQLEGDLNHIVDISNSLTEEIIYDDKTIMLTYLPEKPSKRSIQFLIELSYIVPGVAVYRRKSFPLSKISKFAHSKGMKTLLVLCENRNGDPDGFHICTLPNGPTTTWKLTSLYLATDIKGCSSCNFQDNPEIVFSNFVTRLGMRVARQLKSIFGSNAICDGRRVVTFHNQRDFVFFRHHRYDFEETCDDTREEPPEAKGSKGVYGCKGNAFSRGKTRIPVKHDTPLNGDPRIGCKLKEIGPSFTIKLRSLQLGLFGRNTSDYEYVWRPDSQVSRKKFFL